MSAVEWVGRGVLVLIFVALAGLAYLILDKWPTDSGSDLGRVEPGWQPDARGRWEA